MISLVITICILAFPVRLIANNQFVEATLKICKGLIFISILLVLMKRERLLLEKFVLSKVSKETFIKLLPSVGLLFCYLVPGSLKNLNAFDGSLSLLTLTLLGTFIAASAEEVIFRGYILNLLRKERFSTYRSLIISTLLFSIIHIINIFRYEDVWGVLNQIIFAFALGMLLGSMYLLTNNLMFVCVFHFVVNIPSAIRSLNPASGSDIELLNPSFSENILSTFFIITLTLPCLMLAWYYMKIIEKRDNVQERNDKLALVE